MDVTDRIMAAPHRGTAGRSTGREPARTAWVLLALFGPLAIWVSGVLLAAGLVPDTLPDGQCEGIGWGCMLTPRDGVLFTGLLVGVPGVPVATLLASAGLLLRDPARRTWVAAVVGLCGAITAALVVLTVAAPPNT